MAGVQSNLSDHKIELCPSTACLNLDLLWFLRESGCVCSPEAISRVSQDSEHGAADLHHRRTKCTSTAKPLRQMTPWWNCQLAAMAQYPEVPLPALDVAVAGSVMPHLTQTFVDVQAFAAARLA